MNKWHYRIYDSGSNFITSWIQYINEDTLVNTPGKLLGQNASP